MAGSDRLDEESSSIVVVTPICGSDKTPEETTKEGDGKVQEATFDGTTDGEAKPTSDEEKEEEGEKIIIGMVCDTKNLYQKFDIHNRFTWTEKYPDDLEEAAENEETMKYAVLVRNSKLLIY
jgi:hypothetical protein